jgi:hypothetical protein
VYFKSIPAKQCEEDTHGNVKHKLNPQQWPENAIYRVTAKDLRPSRCIGFTSQVLLVVLSHSELNAGPVS